MNMHRLILMRVGLLDSLSEEQISAVQECFRRRHLAEGAVLFRHGERCEHLHLIEHGSLRLLAGPDDSRIVGLATPGHVLGEAGVFLAMPYPCSAVGNQESLIASLHRNDLRRLADSLPGFGWQLLRLVSRHLIASQVQVEALSSAEVYQRVGGTMLHLTQDVAAEGPRGPVTVAVRQAEIGQMAGVSRESVSRLLAAWGRAGLVTVGRGRLTIPDLDRFRAMLEANRSVGRKADTLTLRPRPKTQAPARAGGGAPSRSNPFSGWELMIMGVSARRHG
jgi:CRP/FNR family cyclic AMP-dependent transcriptional regulator